MTYSVHLLTQLCLQPCKSHLYTIPLVAVTMLAQRQLRNLAFTLKREDDPPFPVVTFRGKKILPLKVKMSALCLLNA